MYICTDGTCGKSSLVTLTGAAEVFICFSKNVFSMGSCDIKSNNCTYEFKQSTLKREQHIPIHLNMK